MARIRSVHPGLFTDEAFMSASPLARLLMIGLWTEAWDDGVFEWKPIVIKARLFPADACDVVALLDELSALHVIKRVERSGKAWGLIRNFRKFQRPKKPNSSGMATADDVEFLGPDHVSSEPVPNQFRTSSEILPQMEDGGGRKKETTLKGASANGIDTIEDQCREAAGCENSTSPSLFDLSPIRRCLAGGASLEMDILPALRAIKARGKSISSWKYAEQPIMDAKASREAPAMAGNVTIPQPRGQPPPAKVSNNRRILDALNAMEPHNVQFTTSHGGPVQISTSRPVLDVQHGRQGRTG